MLVSMTGHGQSSIESESLSVHLEIRTINNRFFKVTMTSELPAELQSSIEEAIRKRVTRGTVNVRVQIAQQFDTSQFRLNETALEAYRKQLADMGLGDSVSTDALLMLPGVVAEQKMFSDVEKIWPVVERALNGALDRLDEMRCIEGSAMADSLLENLRQLEECMRRIDILAPKVVEQFSQRLTERINTLLQKHDVSVQASDVVREIGIFAERADIA
ncbi:MAG: YicC/YloC family endoribonuclease, partial [Pirellulaceae bacterium]